MGTQLLRDALPPSGKLTFLLPEMLISYTPFLLEPPLFRTANSRRVLGYSVGSTVISLVPMSRETVSRLMPPTFLPPALASPLTSRLTCTKTFPYHVCLRPQSQFPPSPPSSPELSTSFEEHRHRHQSSSQTPGSHSPFLTHPSYLVKSGPPHILPFLPLKHVFCPMIHPLLSSFTATI